MRLRHCYEWTKEVKDENGDVIENDFADDLTPEFINQPGELALVLNVGTEEDGLQDRFWCYVVNGKLNDHFVDGGDHAIDQRPPRRYAKRLAAAIKKLG